jgi:hypothetical protein
MKRNQVLFVFPFQVVLVSPKAPLAFMFPTFTTNPFSFKSVLLHVWQI